MKIIRENEFQPPKYTILGIPSMFHVYARDLISLKWY